MRRVYGLGVRPNKRRVQVRHVRIVNGRPQSYYRSERARITSTTEANAAQQAEQLEQSNQASVDLQEAADVRGSDWAETADDGGALEHKNLDRNTEPDDLDNNIEVLPPNVVRKAETVHTWNKLRPTLLNAHYSAFAPLMKSCSRCQQHIEDIVFCPDCGPLSYFCPECFEDSHQFIKLHIALHWQGEVYQLYSRRRQETFSLPGHEHAQGCNCGATMASTITLFDENGRQHYAQVIFCPCMKRSETLVRLGFWPVTPEKPTSAIHMRFMDKTRSFLLEGPVALRKFCAATSHYHQSLPHYAFQKKAALYRAVLQCAPQYRQFRCELNQFKGKIPSFPDGSLCPLCQKTKDVLPRIVSLDANFRLVRKLSAGPSYCPPLHGTQFFLEEQYVNRFLVANATDVHAQNDCASDFHAGSSKRNAFKSKGLDITGIFGSVCIHNYPIHFIHLTAGEKIKYSVAVLNKIREGENGPLNVMYDIACRIRPQLEASGMSMDAVSLAVPVFHGFAHDIACQINYNPRLLDAYRLADGENIERFWSSLGQFAYITREMSASSRQDLLVDVLLHMGQKVVVSAPQTIAARAKSAACQLTDANKVLDHLTSTVQVDGIQLTRDIIAQWALEFPTLHGSKRPVPNNTLTRQERYVQQLNSYYSLAPHVVDPPILPAEIQLKDDAHRLEAALIKHEAALRVAVRWREGSAHYIAHLARARAKLAVGTSLRMHHQAIERQHLLALKGAARGHKSAQRISIQMQTVNAKLVRSLRDFNVQQGRDADNQVQLEQVVDPMSPFYSDVQVTHQAAVPFAVLKEGVYAHELIARATEETAALKAEIQGLLQYHRDVHHLLEESLEEHVSPGVKAYTLEALLRNETAQLDVSNAARKIFQLVLEPDYTFRTRVLMMGPTIVYQEESDADESADRASETDSDDVGIEDIDDLIERYGVESDSNSTFW